MSESRHGPVAELIRDVVRRVEQIVPSLKPTTTPVEVGTVLSVGPGIARVSGLPSVGLMELLEFPQQRLGLAFNLDPQEIGVILLDKAWGIRAGDEVGRTQRVLDVPVGEALLGRVIDAVGRPIDEAGPVSTARRAPVERPAPAIRERSPVTVPLQTGIKVVDALIPVGRGQRELILGDRQTGKTTIAVDAMLNQRLTDVLCVYCAIGQRSSSIARVIDDLKTRGALAKTVIVATTEDDPAGEQFVAPYAAMSIAEHLMRRGRDVLIVFDDLTRHARAYRELSLLLRRPPGREAYPGDIFYIHSRLLERSTRLRDEYGGGSITALPIVETEAQNLSAYIPTNLISITDGQIYLSPTLFDKGVLPAVDVGKSVSRVGGKTQLKAYREVAADLRLSYSQFEELEAFARFGTRLDERTRQVLERGRRVREVLKQPPYQPLPAADQIAILLAVTEGLLDHVPLADIEKAEELIRQALAGQASDIANRIEQNEGLGAEDSIRLLRVLESALEPLSSEATGARADL